jgi:glycolate oxidase
MISKARPVCRMTAISEHGVGLLKRGGRVNELSPTVLGLHRATKDALDPAGILNPGKIFV